MRFFIQMLWVLLFVCAFNVALCEESFPIVILFYFFNFFFPVCNLVFQGSNGPLGVHIALGDTVDQMVIMWSTAKAASNSKVRFGRDASLLSHSVDATSVVLEDGVSHMHTAILKLLAARDTYYYRCGNDEDGWSSMHHFAREGDTMPDIETVTFITYGDMGVHFANSNSVLLAVQKEKLDAIDFVFHAGDLAYAFKNMTRWSVFMSRIQPIAAYVPYLVCLGNRDDLADVDKR